MSGGRVSFPALAATVLLAAAAAFIVHRLAVRVASPATTGVAADALPSLGAVPSFSLTSEQGKPVARTDYAGKVWIADFVFTRCGGTCPIMSSQMSKLAKKLADEPLVRFVSFSVDPDHDTVEALAEYAKTYGADPARWTFLRGEREVIRVLASAGFKLAVEDGTPGDPEPILHSTRFVLVDRTGQIRGYYDGTSPDACKHLVEDARRLAGGGA